MKQKFFRRFFYSTQKIPSLEHVTELFNSLKYSTQKFPLNNCETFSTFFSLSFSTTAFQTFETFQLWNKFFASAH